jgi:RND family efflux transporter MFP subunit
MNSLKYSSGSIPSKRHFLIFFIFVISTVMLLSSCGKKKEEVKNEVVRPVKLLTVGGTGADLKRSYPGKVRASQRVDLAFQVSGPLVELPIDEGQEVKKGKLIARIQPRDFETELTKRKAKTLESKQQYERYRDLYIKKQVSKADFDRYKSQFDIATAREKEARDALNDTYLRAPFSGVVARKYVENFQEVKAKEPIISLQDISRLEVLVDVPELVVSRLKKNKKIKVYAEFESAPGKQFSLSLKEFKTEADPRTQTYQITLEMPAPKDENILPGMTANVIAMSDYPEVTKEATRVVIPAVAVFPDETGIPHVWVVAKDDMTVQKRKITTGELTGSASIQVMEGLELGDVIAVTGVTQLREGMKVSDLSKLEGYGK